MLSIPRFLGHFKLRVAVLGIPRCVCASVCVYIYIFVVFDLRCVFDLRGVVVFSPTQQLVVTFLNFSTDVVSNNFEVTSGDPVRIYSTATGATATNYVLKRYGIVVPGPITLPGDRAYITFVSDNIASSTSTGFWFTVSLGNRPCVS
jgi:hypothetical protein